MNKEKNLCIATASNVLNPLLASAHYKLCHLHLESCRCREDISSICTCPNELKKEIENSFEFEMFDGLFTASSLIKRAMGGIPMQRRKVRK